MINLINRVRCKHLFDLPIFIRQHVGKVRRIRYGYKCSKCGKKKWMQ